jgi:superfamily II DNA or RNA helicase
MIPYARHTPAFKLGRWDGKVSYCDIAGRTYLNLLDKVLPIIESQGYEIEIEDLRKEAPTFNFDLVDVDSYSHLTWPKGHPLEGQGIKIRDHQVDVVNTYLQNLTGINIAPTGLGKTIVCAILSHKVQDYGRSIIIVPSKDLVTQTEEDYINFGLDVGVFYGDRKEYNKTHTICTWQSLESLSKKSKNEDLDIDIDDFCKGVVAVIVDETHLAKGEILRKILSGPLSNVPIRWGLTGTMPEEEFQKVAIIACIGPLLAEIKTKELQDKGILAKLHINAWQLQDLNDGAFKTYQAELKWLTTNKARLEFIANQISKISESGNTLVLVDRIEAGEMLCELIQGSVFVSGKMKSKDRKEEYKLVQNVDNKVLIGTFSVLATGTNIPRLFNLVLIEPGKSFVRVIQSIGRGLRVTPDKNFVEVYDISSNSKFSKRHLSKRKKFYEDAQYPYKLTKINY